MKWVFCWKILFHFLIWKPLLSNGCPFCVKWLCMMLLLKHDIARLERVLSPGRRPDLAGLIWHLSLIYINLFLKNLTIHSFSSILTFHKCFINFDNFFSYTVEFVCSRCICLIFKDYLCMVLINFQILFVINRNL